MLSCVYSGFVWKYVFGLLGFGNNSFIGIWWLKFGKMLVYVSSYLVSFALGVFSVDLGVCSYLLYCFVSRSSWKSF